MKVLVKKRKEIWYGSSGRIADGCAGRRSVWIAARRQASGCQTRCWRNNVARGNYKKFDRKGNSGEWNLAQIKPGFAKIISKRSMARFAVAVGIHAEIIPSGV